MTSFATAALASIVFMLYTAYVEMYVLTGTNLHRTLHPRLYDIDNMYTYTESEMSEQEAERVEIGRQRASEQRIVIAGLAMNISERASNQVKRAGLIGAFFKDYRVVVFENDSTDGTREVIEEISKSDHHVELVPCCDMGSCGCNLGEKRATENAPSRIEKMALYRNKLLTHILARYSDYEYVLMVDLDAEGYVSLDGLFHTLSYDKWDAIASNGQFPLPSSFGFSTATYDGLAYLDRDDEYDVPDRNASSVVFPWVKQNYRVMTHSGLFKRDTSLVPVKSAFNGAAIYRLNRLQHARYGAVTNCEHIDLHREMNSENIFINPYWAWYVGYQGEEAVGRGSHWPFHVTVAFAVPLVMLGTVLYNKRKSAMKGNNNTGTGE